jgi:hypothetical protein
MSNPYIAIKAVLEADTPTQTALAGGQIWSYWPRTYTTPCIVIEIDKEDEQNQLTGASDSGMLISPVTITCRAGDPGGGPAAYALWLAVRNVLSGKTIAGIDYILDDTADSATPKSDGSTDHWYDKVMSFNVTRFEPIT